MLQESSFHKISLHYGIPIESPNCIGNDIDKAGLVTPNIRETKEIKLVTCFGKKRGISDVHDDGGLRFAESASKLPKVSVD
jgi:hypothetical protein